MNSVKTSAVVSRVALITGGLLYASLALAASDPAPADKTRGPTLAERLDKVFPVSEDQHAVALTFSAGIAETVLLELQAEINLPDRHSFALVVGGGAWPGTASGAWLARVRAGAQYRYVALGDFDQGIYVGVEPLVEIVPTSPGPAWSIRSHALVGGKYTTDFGLVMDVGFGPGAVVSNFGPPQFSMTANVGLGVAFGSVKVPE